MTNQGGFIKKAALICHCSRGGLFVACPGYVPHSHAIFVLGEARWRQVDKFDGERAGHVDVLFDVRVEYALVIRAFDVECVHYRAVLFNIDAETDWVALVERYAEVERQFTATA